MTTNYEQFRKELLKVSGPREHSIKGSLGTLEAYRHYNATKPGGRQFNISLRDYRTVINRMNELLVDKLLTNTSITLPLALGQIKISKVKPRLNLTDDGKLINTNPVDMKETLKLWHEDKDALDKRILVKLDNEWIFRFTFNKNNSKCHNKEYFHFKVGRPVKKKLQHKINKENFDSYEHYKMNRY
jgi:hypothetical protein